MSDFIKIIECEQELLNSNPLKKQLGSLLVMAHEDLLKEMTLTDSGIKDALGALILFTRELKSLVANGMINLQDLLSKDNSAALVSSTLGLILIAKEKKEQKELERLANL